MCAECIMNVYICRNPLSKSRSSQMETLTLSCSSYTTPSTLDRRMVFVKHMWVHGWLIPCRDVSNIETETKWPTFSRRYFKLIFFNDFQWTLLYFDEIVTEVCLPTVIHHWFRCWLGTGQATGHYLNQYWPSLLMYICIDAALGLNTSTHRGREIMAHILHFQMNTHWKLSFDREGPVDNNTPSV